MIFTDITYISYQEEIEKIASLASAYGSLVNTGKTLYRKASTNPAIINMGMGATKGLGGVIGGGVKTVGDAVKSPTLKRYSDAIGEGLAQAAMKRGGIVKKPTIAHLAEDGDPEAVIPLGNDKADIRNRKRVLKKALKVMKAEKRKG